jgi:hypothetical protein
VKMLWLTKSVKASNSPITWQFVSFDDVIKRCCWPNPSWSSSKPIFDPSPWCDQCGSRKHCLMQKNLPIVCMSIIIYIIHLIHFLIASRYLRHYENLRVSNLITKMMIQSWWLHLF